MNSRELEPIFQQRRDDIARALEILQQVAGVGHLSELSSADTARVLQARLEKLEAQIQQINANFLQMTLNTVAPASPDGIVQTETMISDSLATTQNIANAEDIGMFVGTDGTIVIE